MGFVSLFWSDFKHSTKTFWSWWKSTDSLHTATFGICSLYLIALEIRSESYGTKIKLRQQGCVPYGGSRKESVPCLFQLLEATCVAWLVALSL